MTNRVCRFMSHPGAFSCWTRTASTQSVWTGCTRICGKLASQPSPWGAAGGRSRRRHQPGRPVPAFPLCPCPRTNPLHFDFVLRPCMGRQKRFHLMIATIAQGWPKNSTRPTLSAAISEARSTASIVGNHMARHGHS